MPNYPPPLPPPTRGLGIQLGTVRGRGAVICLAALAAALTGCVRIQVSNRFPGCRFERECGALLGVDCESAVDGPYLYVRKSDLKVVTTCGGACMSGGCTNCPPKEWTCPTY